MSSSRFGNLDDCLDFLFQATDYEKIGKVKYTTSTFDLNRVRALLNVVGNPDAGLNIVHVAGTKGKGSTSIMVAQLLHEAGARVGLFTSPHVRRWEERIQVNGQEIPERSICEHMSRLRSHVERERRERPELSPTFFEIITAVALMHFRECAADWAVLEVGLGGRLDATNVVSPRVCVITPIGHDHMDKLGNTLAQIATEKAGIVKPGVPVVSAHQESEALSVIRKTVRERNASLRMLGKDMQIDGLSIGPDGNRFALRTWRGEYPAIELPLLGRHQAENFATAVGALEVLREAGHVRCGDAVVPAAGARVRCPGRVELRSGKPPLIIDGAHTVESAQVLKLALQETFPGRGVVAIVGIASDKDVEGVLREIVPWSRRVLFTKVLDNERASDPEHLAAIARQIDPNIPADTVAIGEALPRARALAEPGGLVCVTGSMYLAGEMAKAADALGDAC